ncbi:MAG TPA: response regulator transcription factor [Vulgatibacter sp.]
MRVLVVEDARSLARSLQQGLVEEGFAVDLAHDGEDGLHMASEIAYDAVVLDRMLPKLDGLSLLRELRARGVETPVLLLTALGELEDRVEGLDGGADDYLVKPFAFSELVARLRVLVRRGHGRTSNRVALGDLVLDLSGRKATVKGAPLDLTAKELALLELLALHPGETLTRTSIAEAIYGEDEDRDSNVIDVFVARLRRKLSAASPDGAAAIATVRGIGYRLDVEGSK